MLNQIMQMVGGAFGKNNHNVDNIEQVKESTYGEKMDTLFEEEVINHVNNEFTRRQSERIPFELQWQLNMHYLQGHQYCDIDDQTQQIKEIPKPFWYSEREVYNHIAPIYETRMAKLGRVNPALAVRPATNDINDIATAKICKNIVDSTYTKQEMSRRIKNACGWSEITGSVFYKQIWNPNLGRLIGDMEGQEVYEGDIEQIMVPPYEIYPDSCFRNDLSENKSLIHAKAYHVDEISEIWGKEIKSTTADVFTLAATKVGLGGLGYTATVNKIKTETKKDHAVVIEYYERPCKKYPNGRLIIICKDELLYYGELPYANGEDGKRDLPFSRQVCIDIPGLFFGESVITRLIPVQRSYNALKNRIREYLNRVAIQNLAYEEGSIENIEDIEADGLAPGDHVVYKRNARPPSFMQNAPLPAEFTREEDKLINEFIMISGVSEISRNSSAPTGVGSGIALDILTEQDNTRISLTAEHVRNAIIRTAKHWLRLYKQFTVGERLARFTGKNNDVSVLYFQSSDITSDDVILETENELAQSAAQRKQMVFDLLDRGLFNNSETGQLDKEARAKVFEMLELGNWEQADDVSQIHINRSLRENMMLEHGEMPIVNEYDDDEIHINQHIKYILAGDFERDLAQNPELKTVLDEHIKMHQMSLAYKMQPTIPQDEEQIAM